MEEYDWNEGLLGHEGPRAAVVNLWHMCDSQLFITESSERFAISVLADVEQKDWQG